MIRPRFLLPWLLPLVLPPAGRADDWPQWLGPQRDGVWRETGILEVFPAGGPIVRWRTDIGTGYSGPALADGRLYVMDRRGPGGGEPPPRQGSLPGTERVLCLDSATGKLLWKHEYDCPYRIAFSSGPRTTPVVHQGKVFTLGAMGDLYCLEAATGKPIWSQRFPDDYKAPPPVWGWSAHLLVDGDKVFTLVGGEGSAVVAFHKDTGAEAWRALTVEEIGYAPPMIFEAGGRRQLIIWHTEALVSLDPESGKPFWSEPYPVSAKLVRPGITVATPRKAGNLLFLTSPHHGPLMFQLERDRPAASLLWKGTSNNIGKSDGLHSLMSTPLIKDGHIYGICAFGELRCLKADTGERLWESLAATTRRRTIFATAFLVQHGDRCFLFNDNGDLIIARLSPAGYAEIDRAHLLDPIQAARGRNVVWCHPAFANRCVYVRNDKEIICASLAADIP